MNQVLAQPIDPFRFPRLTVYGSGTSTFAGPITAKGPITITGNAQLRGINGATGSAVDLSTGIAQMTTGAGAAGLLCTNSTATCAFTGSAAVASGVAFNWAVGDSYSFIYRAGSNALRVGTAGQGGAFTTSGSFASENGITTNMGAINVNAGTVTVGGQVNVTTADVTSSGASNLISYTLPANALTVTNRCLKIVGWGTALNNANAKTVALDFGSQTVITKQLTPSIASTTWKVQAVVCRSGSSTQDIYAEAWNPMGTTVSSVDGNTVLYQAARTAGTQTETATITIKGKTTVATTTDVTMDGLTVEFL